jgi:hypothetical protein
VAKCKCCQREKELRFGFCFDCADAESVIAKGVDMWENEIPQQEGMSKHMSKVHYILKKYEVIK